MRIGSLFAGIGGFDLAARWMGWDTAWYSEIDPYAAAVMKKHFPEAANLGDVTQLDGKQVVPVDLLCGGFPCQDISLAGKGAGLGGARSGLWFHYARLIEEIQPRWVVAENVSALRSRGLDRVLGSLAALGYDAEWHCIPASYVGAPHRRDRVWIIAYPRGTVNGAILGNACRERLNGLHDGSRDERSAQAASDGALDVGNASSGNAVADAYRAAREGRTRRSADSEGRRGGAGARTNVRRSGEPRPEHAGPSGEVVAHANDAGCSEQRGSIATPQEQPAPERAGWWSVEPNVGRVVNGVPSRVDCLRCLGNAVVPQVPALIFSAIHEVEQARLREIA